MTLTEIEQRVDDLIADTDLHINERSKRGIELHVLLTRAEETEDREEVKRVTSKLLTHIFKIPNPNKEVADE